MPDMKFTRSRHCYKQTDRQTDGRTNRASRDHVNHSLIELHLPAYVLTADEIHVGLWNRQRQVS